MLWVINLRIALFKLLERTWELFFLVKGIVSKLVSLHYRLFTWKLVPSFIWSLCCWALLNCSLKHGVDLLECIQSGPKKKSKKKLLKVNFFLELWSSHLTTAHYNSLLVYVQYILRHGVGNKEKLSFYDLLLPWLKNTLVPLLGCCHGEWIWKTASYWCDPTRWDWCYLWGYRSTRKCQGNIEGVSYASFAKTWVVLQRTTYEGIYHSPNLRFVKILLYVCLFVEIGFCYILIILFPWAHCFSFDFVSHLLLG